MEVHLDSPPRTLFAEPFPIGDVSISAAEQAMADVEHLAFLVEQRGKVANYIAHNRTMAALNVYDWYPSSDDIPLVYDLLEDWARVITFVDAPKLDGGSSQVRAEKMARDAFLLTVGLVNKGLLPPVKTSYAYELGVMKSAPLSEVRFIVYETWEIMKHNHPLAFGVLNPWATALCLAFNTQTDSEDYLVNSAIALPYLFSSVSSAEHMLINGSD